MTEKEIKQSLLRQLPAVDQVLEAAKQDPFLKDTSRAILVRCVRSVVEKLRTDIIADKKKIPASRLSHSSLLENIKTAVTDLLSPNLIRTVNATGIIVHTNLGRSMLCTEAIDHMIAIAGRYSNLEYDLALGKRGSRYACVEDMICELCGSQAALVVNNNAGAVFLGLETIAKNKKVIISRGELVEIGGSFRIPDVMAKSGAILKEVGTTNRTHLSDYESAIEADTGLLLKVHKSNYAIEGFTAEVSLRMLVELGEKYTLPVMEDLGSGTLIDFSKYGLLKEPTVQESVSSGADIVTFSGDKLLGGPQAGIIVGKKDPLEQIKKNPLTRALRVDKLTFAALESTLSLYRDEKIAIASIPTLRMLTLPLEMIENKAKQLAELLAGLKEPKLSYTFLQLTSRAGGGALPYLTVPTVCLGIKIHKISANSIEKFMRGNSPPIIGRLENDLFIMDLRTILEDELSIIKTAFANLLNKA